MTETHGKWEGAKGTEVMTGIRADALGDSKFNYNSYEPPKVEEHVVTTEDRECWTGGQQLLSCADSRAV